MNSKLKIALLALLGFSTASCASKKASKRAQDKDLPSIEADSVDTRIMLMYGVPMPGGRPAIIEEPERGAALMPDGRVAKPLTDEEAQKALDAIREERAERDSIDLQIRVMYGVPPVEGEVKLYDDSEARNEAAEFPDGSVAKPLTDEAAQAALDAIREEQKAREAENK